MQAVVLLLREPGLEPLAPAPAALCLGAYPVLEGCLRFLEAAGCTEVHLVAAVQCEQLAAYLHKAGWTSGARQGGATVHVLAAPGCATEGDALRLVDQKDVIKGDFVLVSGCVVSNADLRPALNAHLARRTADRQAMLTVLLRRAASRSEQRASRQDTYLAVVDPHSQQLLKFDPEEHASGHAATLGTHLLGERDSVEVRTGARLANIYICAPDVLMLLSDNFDYQGIARDLVPGVLSEQELGGTVHVSQITGRYAQRICNTADYSNVVEDVLGRWAYPWTPDNFGEPQDLCRFNRGAYIDGTALVASGGQLSKGSLVGRGSTVDASARVQRSVLGSDCHVGRGASLQGSCLQSGARVEDACRLSSALLAEEVVVRSHARVEAGAVLGRRTVIDTAHTVPAGTRVSLVQAAELEGSDEELERSEADCGQVVAAEAAAQILAAGGIPEVALGFDERAVGPFGAGFVFAEGNWPPAGLLSLEADSDSEDFLKESQQVDEPGQSGARHGTDQFKQEVAETFLRCITEHISHDNVVIELNSLKIAEDRTFADCARYIFTTMLSLCLPARPPTKPEYHGLFPAAGVDSHTSEGRLELLRRVNTRLRSWRPLMQRFLKSVDDQVELLLTFEEYCAEEGDFAGDQGATFTDVFPQVVKLCYDHDLLCEEAILDWAHEKEHAASEDRRFVELCSDLVAWLQHAEEESSADSADDSD